MNANTIKKLSVAALLVFAIAAPVGAHAGPDEAAAAYESMGGDAGIEKMAPAERIQAYGDLLDAAGSDPAPPTTNPHGGSDNMNGEGSPCNSSEC